VTRPRAASCVHRSASSRNRRSVRTHHTHPTRDDEASAAADFTQGVSRGVRPPGPKAEQGEGGRAQQLNHSDSASIQNSRRGEVRATSGFARVLTLFPAPWFSFALRESATGSRHTQGGDWGGRTPPRPVPLGRRTARLDDLHLTQPGTPAGGSQPLTLPLYIRH